MSDCIATLGVKRRCDFDKMSPGFQSIYFPLIADNWLSRCSWQFPIKVIPLQAFRFLTVFLNKFFLFSYVDTQSIDFCLIHSLYRINQRKTASMILYGYHRSFPIWNSNEDVRIDKFWYLFYKWVDKKNPIAMCFEYPQKKKKNILISDILFVNTF